MKQFWQIYNKNDTVKAAKNVKKALLIYILLAVAYVAICATFVTVYVVAEVSVYLCYAVNFVVTVAFAWYSVLFFSVGFAEKREKLRFYRVVDNALLTNYRGKFVGIGETAVKEGHLMFASVIFDTAEGQKSFLVFVNVNLCLGEGITYDLQTVGNKLMSYKEFSND